MPVDPEIPAEIRRLWATGKRRNTIFNELRERWPHLTPNMVSGHMTRLNLHSTAQPERVIGLPSDHAAIREARSLFPSTVAAVPTNRRPRQRGSLSAGGKVLVTGGNSRKFGDRVTKGAWRGMPIFSLTLEERATCPATCENLSRCYGNGMPLAVRYRHGAALEDEIEFELGELQQLFPDGFVVRLHTLGDFVSTSYVARWAGWLDQFPALRVFGYSAWPVETPIGAAVRRLARTRWDRFAVRLSGERLGAATAITLWNDPANHPETATRLREARAVICPAQTGRAASCSSCGLCWAAAARDRPIAFLGHGRMSGPRDAA